MIWPPIVSIYKHGVLLNERWKLFSHSSHRVLSIITHRVTVSFGIAVICLSIISVNVVLAAQPEQGARQFASGSLIDRVIFQDTDVIVSSEQLGSKQPTWWQEGSAVQESLPIDPVQAEAPSQVLQTAITGIALVPPSAITKTERTRTEIEKYVVQDGDTASTIAQKFHLRMQTILDANNIDDPNLIKPGQTLVILPIDGIKYKFKKKDTLKKLAKIYKADIKDILEFNRLDSEKDIKVGQVLILPDGRIPPPPPPPTPVIQQTVTTPVTAIASTTTTTTTTPTTTETVPTEVAEVPEAPAVPTEPSAASGSLIWPTTTDRISQGYGYGHTGLDIDGEFGDPINAADNGTVISAGWAGAYGNMVAIDHGNGIVTRYAHLQAIYVSAGQAVAQGQQLGEEGSTGNSSGSHLHYEVMVNGQFANPYAY